MLVTLAVFIGFVVILSRIFGEKRYNIEDIVAEAEGAEDCNITNS